jgi:hypothetical protein
MDQPEGDRISVVLDPNGLMWLGAGYCDKRVVAFWFVFVPLLHSLAAARDKVPLRL